MSLNKIISEIDSIYNGGIACDYGCNEHTLDEAIENAEKDSTSKSLCGIDRWTWVDIDVSPSELSMFTQRNVFPSFVYGTVVFDESDRDFKTVLSTLLIDFRNSYLFETRNTRYLLIGSGRRTLIGPQAFSTLFLSRYNSP